MTWAQLEFLVDGDPARLAPLRRRAVPTATADNAAAEVVRLPDLDFQTLTEAWATTYGGDRRPGVDCAVPVWTPVLAALAARQKAAAEAVAQAMADTTDYLAFGRAVPIRSLLSLVVNSGDADVSRPTPTADPRVSRYAADLQRLGAAYDAADADYRDAVRQAVAAAPARGPADP